MITKVIGNEFKKSIKNKKLFVLMVLLPIITILIALFINNYMKTSINIGIIGGKNSSLREDLLHYDYINLDNTEEEYINTDMMVGKYTFIIDLKNENEPRVYALDKEAQSIVEDIIKNYNETKDLVTLDRLYEKSREGELTTSQRAIGLMFMVMLISSTIIANSIIKDRESGVLTRVSVTPLSKVAYILGGFLYNLIFSSIQIALTMIIIKIVNIDIGISLLTFLGISTLLVFIVASITTFLANVCNTELQSSSIVSAIAAIMTILGGGFLPLSKMPEGINFISNFTVTKWLIKLSDTADVFERNSSVTSILILTVMSILFIIIGTTIG